VPHQQWCIESGTLLLQTLQPGLMPESLILNQGLGHLCTQKVLR